MFHCRRVSSHARCRNRASSTGRRQTSPIPGCIAKFQTGGWGTTRKDAWFSWRKRMYRRDDGEWDNPGPFVEFRTAGLTKEQEQAAGLLKRVIRKRLDILEGH